MQAYQKAMIALSLEAGALKFGEFTLKSGRVSPYFFNFGMFNTGELLAKLGRIYADAYVVKGLSADTVFGPAYKGIPLVATMATFLAVDHQLNLPYSFNRKEVKSHGEGGQIVGAALRGNVVVVDDVITAGTAIRESIDLISAEGGELSAVLVALDRQERGQGELSAIQELASERGIAVHAIITLADILTYVSSDSSLVQWREAIERYQSEYGVTL
jgi:orotate phosphoribosyltransferase